MRLIDADKVLYMDHEEAMDHIEHGCDYNIDKVVEELEEEYQMSESTDHDPYYEGKMMAFDRAIEIVKGGTP